MTCRYNFCDGDFEKCYNNKCTCPCHTTGERVPTTISIETYTEKVELFEKELERIKKILPRHYALLHTKYREIFSST